MNDEAIILGFLRWLDTKFICLASTGGPGEIVEIDQYNELVTEFMDLWRKGAVSDD